MWRLAEVASDDYHLCPNCKGHCEVLVEVEDGIEYNKAERCPKCRWIVDFEADEIKPVSY